MPLGPPTAAGIGQLLLKLALVVADGEAVVAGEQVLVVEEENVGDDLGWSDGSLEGADDNDRVSSFASARNTAVVDGAIVGEVFLCHVLVEVAFVVA